MAIIFGGDAGIREDGSAAGIFSKLSDDITDLLGNIGSNFSRVSGKPAGISPVPKESVFIDDGFSNVPGTAFLGTGVDNIDDIQTRRITTQEPILTVYIKKRQFWSLRGEYDTRFMDSSEKLFMRATKLLFERKCSQVSAYESLTKASALVSEEVDIDSNRIRELLELLGALSVDLDHTNSSDVFDELRDAQGELKSVINNLGKFYDLAAYSELGRHATRTTWVVDPEDSDSVNTGRGVGVIELTMISDINTSLDIDSGGGSVSFTMQDPYNLMKITNDDIEASLSAAFDEDFALSEILKNRELSPETLSDNLNRGPEQILEEARRKESVLAKARRERIGGGTPLTSADFPEIVFEINPTSFSSKKVTATVTTLPESFDKNNFNISLIALPSIERLDANETALVTEIFDLLDEYVLVVQSMNKRNKNINSHDSVKYARRQLRKFYLGKPIVQPMDGIHVYMRSKTIKDGEGVGPLDALLTGSKFVQQFATDNDVADDALEEEMRQFKIDDIGISTALYKILRSSSFLRNAGTHVFGGLITSSSEDYSASSGIYTTSISGESNSKWLNMSRVHVKPSLDQVEGVLEDPLTQFKFTIEEGTGLIKGREYLQDNAEKMDQKVLNHTSGSSRSGQKAKSDNLDTDYVDNGDGSAQIVQSHVPGMKYRWKEGIVAVTRDVNLKRPLDGSDNQSEKLSKDFGLTVVSGSEDSGPFANLDAADIVSLLVTGVPHNYESFYENSTSVGTFTPGAANSSESFFNSFFDVERRKRKALGNFQPFKTISINQKNLHTRFELQQSFRDGSKSLSSLRSERAELQNNLYTLEGTSFRDGLAPKRDKVKEGLVAAIAILDNKISEALVRFKSNKDEAISTGLRLIGNDPTTAITETSTVESIAEGEAELDKSIRLRNTLSQVRTQIQCKLNRDNNLFIVGDEYDKDLDIQAFVLQSLNSQETPTWETGFKLPHEICKNVAKTLDFEFYCDTQGHLQFRPPRYNKTPLSLLLKLFALDDREGKQIYPDFLKSLFGIKSKTVSDQLMNIDIEIQINVAKLGGDSSLYTRAATAISEEIISDDTNTPDSFQLSSVPTNITSGKVSNTDVAAEVVSLINKLKGSAAVTQGSQEEKDIHDEVKALNDSSTVNVSTKRLAISSKISSLVSRRQLLASTLTKIKSQEDKFSENTGRLANDMKHKGREELLAPFKDIIEDDFVDFLGPGSSKRYIIYDDQIISSNFTESDANIEFTRVDVTGAQDIIGDGPRLGGVPVFWAGATDFDMWRQYGWRTQGTVNKPFFKDASTQCAPYALMLLTRQRRNAVQGSVTLYGNEYYQLGDVVYANSRDMLYYVTAINHRFDYSSGSFQTTLKLRYGHPLGEYIPTPLDVIGKTLVENQRVFNSTKTCRQTVSESAPVVHLGVALFDNVEGEDGAFRDMLSGQFARENVTQLKNAMARAINHVAKGTWDVEIRAFITDNSDENKEKVFKRMNAMRSWFKDPKGRWQDDPKLYLVLDRSAFTDKSFNDSQLRSVNADIDPVDIIEPNDENKKNARFPSDEVFNSSARVGIDNVVEAVLVKR